MANKYWYGTGLWNSTSNWFLDDLHFSGTTTPTSADDVFFTSNSSTGTCTIFNSYCHTINMTGFRGFLGGSSILTIYDSCIFTGVTFLGTMSFQALYLLTPITFNNIILTTINFNSNGGYVLQDNLVTNNNITLQRGVLNTNGVTVSCRTFNLSGSQVRTLILGSSNIYCSNQWDSNIITNLTFSADTSTIHFSGPSTSNFTGGNQIYYKVYFDGSLPVGYIFGDNTFSELKLQSTSSSLFSFVLNGDQIVTSGLTLVGNTSQYRILMETELEGVPHSITNNGTLIMSDIDFIDIIGTGSTSWVGDRIGDGFGNSGITFDLSRTLYWVGVSGGTWSNINNWSLIDGGVGGEDLPRPQDNVEFTLNSILLTGKTIITDCSILGGNIFFREFQFGKNPTINFTFALSINFFGSYSLCTGITFSNSNSRFYWRGRGNYEFRTSNANFSISASVMAFGGNYTLMDNYNGQGGNLTISSGTLNTNNMDVKTLTLTTTSNYTGLIFGNSNIYLYSTSSYMLYIDPFTNLLAGTSLIKHQSGNLTNNVIFSGGSKIFNNVWFSKSTNTYSISIVGDNTFNNLNLTPETYGNDTIIKFTGNSIQIVTGMTAVGVSSTMIKLQSTTTKSNWTITKSDGVINRICCDYIDISGSTANPIGYFYTGYNSVNSGGNVRWIFTSCTLIKSVSQVLYASTVLKVIGVTQSLISKITGLS